MDDEEVTTVSTDADINMESDAVGEAENDTTENDTEALVEVPAVSEEVFVYYGNEVVCILFCILFSLCIQTGISLAHNFLKHILR